MYTSLSAAVSSKTFGIEKKEKNNNRKTNTKTAHEMSETRAAFANLNTVTVIRTMFANHQSDDTYTQQRAQCYMAQF